MKKTSNKHYPSSDQVEDDEFIEMVRLYSIIKRSEVNSLPRPSFESEIYKPQIKIDYGDNLRK